MVICPTLGGDKPLEKRIVPQGVEPTASENSADIPIGLHRIVGIVADDGCSRADPTSLPKVVPSSRDDLSHDFVLLDAFSYPRWGATQVPHGHDPGPLDPGYARWIDAVSNLASDPNCGAQVVERAG